MKTLTRFAMGALVAALGAAGAATASPLLFTLAGPTDATFVLDSHPTPDGMTAGQPYVSNVSGTFSGLPVVFSLVQFYTQNPPTLDGGLGLSDPSTPGDYLYFSGVQIYSGTAAAPTFSPGHYSDVAFVGGSHLTETIDITAVPEPGAWALMIVGLGGVGSAMRRGRAVARARSLPAV